MMNTVAGMMMRVTTGMMMATRALMDVRRSPIFREGSLTTAKWCNLSGWHLHPDYWSSFLLIIHACHDDHHFPIYISSGHCKENSLACSRATRLLKSGLIAYCSRNQFIYFSYLKINRCRFHTCRRNQCKYICHSTFHRQIAQLTIT